VESSELLAGAIDARGGTAVAAKLFKAVAHLFASAVETDGEIVGRCSQSGSHLLDVLAAEVNPLQEFAVLVGQVGHKPVNALANGALGLGGNGVRKFGAEGLETAFAGISSPIEVYDRMTQDAVEPGNDIFIRRGLFVSFEGFEQAVLNEVFSEVGIANALADESDKGVQVLEDWLLNVVHAGGR
jgi:hypothetical protein